MVRNNLAEKHGWLPDTQGTNHRTGFVDSVECHRPSMVQTQGGNACSLRPQRSLNGVNKTSLDALLRAKRIPTVARKWTNSFMSDRHASMMTSAETTPRANAGLAQGSPLSPVLFAFFNSALVDQPVDSQGGASAFIDDYYRWRVGPSAEENLTEIQSDEIPRIEAWARRTGSCSRENRAECVLDLRRPVARYSP